jgi:uncharacterized lipoprotein YajG
MSLLKKTLSTLSLIFLISSCSYLDRKITIDLNSGHGLEIGEFLTKSSSNIKVTDIRKDKKTLGFKQYGKNIVKVQNHQSLSWLIKNEIIKGLKDRDITLDKNKILEIQIVDFTFNAKRGLIVGESDSNISLRAIIRDNRRSHRYKYKDASGKRTNVIISKTFNLENNYKHFIVSLSKTDQKNINLAIRNIIDDVLGSDEFLSRLLGKKTK